MLVYTIGLILTVILLKLVKKKKYRKTQKKLELPRFDLIYLIWI